MLNRLFLLLLSIVLVPDLLRAQNPAPLPGIPLWKTLPPLPAMPKPEKSGFAAVNGVKIFYAIYNEKAAEPVLLLHGGMSGSSWWAAEIPLLAKTHRVIVIDSRGHGRSTMDSQPFTYTLLSSDILKTMDQLNLSRSAIVGWSDGGIIGLILAMDHPDRVSALLAFGANFNESGYKTEAPDTAAGRKFREQAEADYRMHSATPDSFPQLRKALFRMYGSEPNLDTARLMTVRVPTLIVYGRYEQFISQEHFQKLADLIPGAGLLMLPQVSHGGPLQDPVAFHRAVMYLLEKNRD